MSECACEAVLLGRESVQGTANADSLASLIRLLHRRGGAGRKYRLRCSRDGIEIRPARRRQEDEGFESDDDAVSHTSSDSNSSTFCFVEDHVLKSPLPEPSISCSVATDSANSSGASDNDDADNSLTPTTPVPPPPTDQTLKPLKKPSVDDCLSKEFYAFNDVAFCHTDAAFPKVLVLVIKKKAKLKRDELNPASGLEAVIFQCKSVENLREVCASYKEFSRRLKMDLQFRYPHRRKDSSSDNPSSTLYRNVFNDLQKSMSSTSTTPNSPFFKTWITHVSSTPQPFGKGIDFQTSDSNKYNLVQRTDDDGVTHIEVAKAIDGDIGSSTTASDEYSGSSSIISINTPDEGNLVLSPNQYHSLGDTSRDSSEIEGVICADVDSSPVVVAKSRKGIVESALGHAKKKTNSENNETSSENVEIPPQRPQRGKYVKKNAVKQKELHQGSTKSKPGVIEKDRSVTKTSVPTTDATKQPGTQERVVRGQFIRVNVEQKTPLPSSVSSSRLGNRLFGSESKPSGQMLSYPVWNLPATQQLTKRTHRSREDETDYRSGNGHRLKSYQQRRSRSSGGNGRRSNSPPARPTPVAYRYIDSPQPKPLSNRFFGKLKEIASINNAYVNTLSRRRNSSGDLATAQFYQYLEPALKSSPISKSSTSLKSVIKKKNCNENLEPKKVTFSAYATVQVVD